MTLKHIFNRPDRIAGFLAALVVVVWGTEKILVDHETAHRLLVRLNYTDIKTGGHAWTDCKDTDFMNTKFTAIAPDGQRVTGAVCANERVVLRIK